MPFRPFILETGTGQMTGSCFHSEVYLLQILIAAAAVSSAAASFSFTGAPLSAIPTPDSIIPALPVPPVPAVSVSPDGMPGVPCPLPVFRRSRRNRSFRYRQTPYCSFGSRSSSRKSCIRSRICFGIRSHICFDIHSQSHFHSVLHFCIHYYNSIKDNT